MAYQVFEFFVVVALVVTLAIAKKWRTKSLPLPPGPKKYPIIGNALDLPKQFEWVKYHEWSMEFGSDIIHLDVFGTSIIVIDSYEIACELFDKKSSIYSSRPRFPMMNELMGWDFLFAFMPYGDWWRQHRRLFHQEFHPTASIRYQPQELKHTREMLRRMLDSPGNFIDHLRHATGAIIMSVSYGIDVLPKDDPYITIAEKGLAGLVEAAIPGRFLVDAIPLLKYVPEWFPFAGFQKQAKEWRYFAEQMIHVPFEVVKQNIASGSAGPSFASYCLDRVAKSGEYSPQRERLVQETAGNLYAAGSDTTVSALATFMLAMVCFPKVQTRAQKELDEVLGQARLPDFDDEASLPYVMAIVKEVLRWQPVTPIAIPHFLIAEDEYKGFRHPANSIVIGNAWAMLHDEKMYPDPFNFKPDRWLKDGALNPAIRDPTAVFGFGRRICPGRHMAISSLWITVASILATFNISKATDEKEAPIEPSGEYHSALICHPLPFECSITPRSKDAEQLIRTSF